MCVYVCVCVCVCLKFTVKVGEKTMSAKDRGLDKICAALFMKLCLKYDNLAEVDKIAAVGKKVETVKLVVSENVELALQICVKLETIEKAAGICHA